MTDRPGLLVIGANGFLGAHVRKAAAAAETFNITCAGRTALPETSIQEIDIASAASVDRVFGHVRPQAVLLLAAISDIDKCEAAPEMALAVNARGAENVANACTRHGAKLLFTSTGAVFDGTRHGYRVTARWKEGETVAFPTNEVRNPIDAGMLASVMVQLLGSSDPTVRGLYHVGAIDSVSRYELGLQLAARAGVSASLVRAQVELPPGRAPRGADHFLLTDKIRRECNIEFGPTASVIERCFT
jgi:dTDP-4-dehydrorhamnose reductase